MLLLTLLGAPYNTVVDLSTRSSRHPISASLTYPDCSSLSQTGALCEGPIIHRGSDTDHNRVLSTTPDEMVMVEGGTSQCLESIDSFDILSSLDSFDSELATLFPLGLRVLQH